MAKYKDFDSFYKKESPLGRKEYEKELNEKIKLKNKEIKLSKLSESKPKLMIQPKFIPQGTNITREQDLLQGMFGGHNNQVIFSGNGDSLPKMNGMLREGQGLIKNNDFGRTGRLFGVRR